MKRQAASEKDTTMMACMFFCVCFIVIICQVAYINGQWFKSSTGFMGHTKAVPEDVMLSQRNNSFLWAFVKGFGGGLMTLGPLVFLRCMGSDSLYGKGLRKVVWNLPRGLRFFGVACVLTWVASCLSVFAFGWGWPSAFLTPAPPQGPVFVRRGPLEILQSDGAAYVPEPVRQTARHFKASNTLRPPPTQPNYRAPPNYQANYPAQANVQAQPPVLVHSKLLDPDPPPPPS